MGNIRKKVEVTLDDKGFSSGADKMGQNLAGAFEKANGSIEKIRKNTETIAEKVGKKFAELEATTSDVFKGLLQDSDKYGKSMKDRIKYMEREVQLIERAGREEKARAKMVAQETYKTKIVGTYGEKKERIEKEYERKSEQIEDDSRMQDLQNQKLRDKLKVHKEDMADKEESGRTGGGEHEGGGSFGHKVKETMHGAFEAALGVAGYEFVTSLGGWIGKVIEEGRKDQAAKGKLAGLGGGIGVGDATDFGMDTAEMATMTRNVALSMGRGRGAGGEAVNEVMREVGFGLDSGSMSSMNRALRGAGGGRADTASKAMNEMLAIFKKSDVFGISKGDFTLVGEKLDQANDLNTQQLNQVGKVDNVISSQFLALAGKTGGGAQINSSGFVSALNQGITSPANDFKKAVLYRAIASSSPGANLWEIEKKQKAGIFGQGTFGAVMKDLTRMSGSDPMMMNMNLSRMFPGLNPEQVEGLIAAYKANPNILNNVKSEGDLQRIGGGIRGAGQVGRMDVWQAKTNVKLAHAGEWAIDKVDSFLDFFVGKDKQPDPTMKKYMATREEEQQANLPSVKHKKMLENIAKINADGGKSPEQKKQAIEFEKAMEKAPVFLSGPQGYSEWSSSQEKKAMDKATIALLMKIADNTTTKNQNETATAP